MRCLIKSAIDLLTSSIVGYVCSDIETSPRMRSQVEQCKELCSKSVLTLVKWLQVIHTFVCIQYFCPLSPCLYIREVVLGSFNVFRWGA